MLIYLDDDMIPEPGLVGEHVRAHSDGEDDLVALGYCPASVEAPGLWARVSRGRWEDHYTRKAEADHPWSWLDFSVGNSSMRKVLLETLGGFDEKFARRNEDHDLGVRLTEHNARFSYLPAARAWHDFDARMNEALAQTRRQAYYDVALASKHPSVSYRANVQRWVVKGRLRPKMRAIYPLLAFAWPLMRIGLRLADIMERLDRRKSWWQLTRRLVGLAYAVGIHDALPTKSTLISWLNDPVHRTAPTVTRIDLGQTGKLNLPTAGGEVDIEIYCRGRRLAVVPATVTDSETSWPDLTKRAAAAAAASVPDLPLDEARALVLDRGDSDKRSA